LECLSDASFLGKLLVLPANVRLDKKVITRYKHSSLFGLVVSKERKKFYNIDTRALPNKMPEGILVICLLVLANGAEARPSVFPGPLESGSSFGSGISVIGESPIPKSGSGSDPGSLPVITVSNSSKEGIDIANRINHLFKNLDPLPVREPGEPDRKISTNLNLAGAGDKSGDVLDSGNTNLKLNLNLVSIP